MAHLMVALAAYTFCGVSLLTLTAISVDRLLALLLGLRYRQVVTVKKTYIAILAFWIVSVVGVPASTAIREYVHYAATALCLAITIVAYSKIFFRLRHNQIHRIYRLTRRKPSNSNEHSSIQKGSVQCTVGAGSIGRLLSATYHSDSFNTSKRDAFILLPWLAIYKYFICRRKRES
ncbi:unnamed protein product [Porites evermanni]|uniref:G-protein coupled receptors family 1 profile domain-containing protein n=1 Tax=Porites evermanni TaxID=104178 RepID=A0ABN8SPP3_9CNID|nr:unnamed protein product [Porites evermanni]